VALSFNGAYTFLKLAGSSSDANFVVFIIMFKPGSIYKLARFRRGCES
jgi:hypothetical protein